METNDIKTIARNLLSATHHLFVGPNIYVSQFAKVVEGTFRRDYLTLQTIVYLAECDSPEMQIAFGTSCIDLCRAVLEDFISLKYIIFKGKEDDAGKFFNYQAIEAKRDMDFLATLGDSIDAEVRTIIDKNYNNIKHDFLDTSGKAKRKGWNELIIFLKSQGKLDQLLEQEIQEEATIRFVNVDGQSRRAWAGLDTEAMIKELVEGGVLTTEQQNVLMPTYIEGNMANHFSPTSIVMFLSSDSYNATGRSNLETSLIVVTTLITHMAKIFIGEFEVSKETKVAVDQILQAILQAHLPADE